MTLTGITRRLPVPVRPTILAAGLVLAVAGLALGLAIDWDVSLFTGNVLVQLALGTAVVTATPSGIAWLALAAIGHALVAWSFARPSRRFVFYPMAALLGLFVFAFGAAYLFDAAWSGERTATGRVVFVLFEYAGLRDRPFQSLLGLLVMGIGAAALAAFSFGRAKSGAPTATATQSGATNEPPPGLRMPRT